MTARICALKGNDDRVARRWRPNHFDRATASYSDMDCLSSASRPVPEDMVVHYTRPPPSGMPHSRRGTSRCGTDRGMSTLGNLCPRLARNHLDSQACSRFPGILRVCYSAAQPLRELECPLLPCLPRLRTSTCRCDIAPVRMHRRRRIWVCRSSSRVRPILWRHVQRPREHAGRPWP